MKCRYRWWVLVVQMESKISSCDINEIRQAKRLTWRARDRRDMVACFLWDTARYSNQQIGNIPGFWFATFNWVSFHFSFTSAGPSPWMRFENKKDLFVYSANSPIVREWRHEYPITTIKKAELGIGEGMRTAHLIRLKYFWLYECVHHAGETVFQYFLFETVCRLHNSANAAPCPASQVSPPSTAVHGRGLNPQKPWIWPAVLGMYTHLGNHLQYSAALDAPYQCLNRMKHRL